MTKPSLPANPGGVVYGTILVATLLAAESPRRETFAKTVGAVAIALIVYWLSVVYAELTGERVHEEWSFTVGGVASTAVHELAVLYGALVPLLAVIVCWAAGATLDTGVTVGIWTAVAMIVLTEIVIGVRAELTRGQLLLQTVVGIVLGLLVVALRVLLH